MATTSNAEDVVRVFTDGGTMPTLMKWDMRDERPLRSLAAAMGLSLPTVMHIQAVGSDHVMRIELQASGVSPCW